MTSLGDILKDRIKDNENCQNGLENYFLVREKEYKKNWNFAVKCFQDRINKDRKASDLKPLPFICTFPTIPFQK